MKATKKFIAVFLSVLMLMTAASVGFVPSAATICANHNLVEYSRIAATCQEKGVVNYTCTKCDYNVSEELEIDENNHAFGSWTLETLPGCSTEGVEIRYCVCGASETGVLSATGKHTYADESLLDFWWKAENAGVGTVYEGWTIVKLPTCTTTGLAKTRCTECGVAEKTAELRLHSADFYQAKSEAATCVSNGESHVVCKKCNANYILSIPVDKNNHMLVWETVKEATCTEAGTEAAYCQWHKELGVFDTRATATKPHSYTDYKYQYNAKCGVDGTKKAKCDNCDAEDVITAEGTAMSCLKRWQFVKADSNCTKGGEAKLVCVYCSTVYETKTFKAGEHINPVVMTREPSCEKDGCKYYKCDTCGVEIGDIEGTTIKSSGHDMKWVEVLAPSCIAKNENGNLGKDGKELGTCTRCGATEERTVPFAHHFYDVVPAVPATCDTPGSTAFRRCTDCYETVPSEPIPAFGHNDADGNGCCDVCYEWFLDGTPEGPSCRCLCHNPDGIAGFFYKIYLFFIKLFGMAQTCDCGAIHYEKVSAVK